MVQRLTVSIDLEGAAFHDDSDLLTYSVEDEHGVVPVEDLAAGLEVARILRKLADEAEAGVRFHERRIDAHAILDVNGNRCGEWVVGPSSSTR